MLHQRPTHAMLQYQLNRKNNYALKYVGKCKLSFSFFVKRISFVLLILVETVNIILQ